MLVGASDDGEVIPKWSGGKPPPIPEYCCQMLHGSANPYREHDITGIIALPWHTSIQQAILGVAHHNSGQVKFGSGSVSLNEIHTIDEGILLVFSYRYLRRYTFLL